LQGMAVAGGWFQGEGVAGGGWQSHAPGRARGKGPHAKADRKHVGWGEKD